MIDIGFIGLGTMGRPMAGHLQAAGHRLYLHDVGPIAPELVAGGAIVCKSGKEVTEESDAVIIMVPDTPHVGISLPSTAVAQQLFSSCAAHGGRAWDHSAMVRALEMMASHEIAAA